MRFVCKLMALPTELHPDVCDLIFSGFIRCYRILANNLRIVKLIFVEYTSSDHFEIFSWKDFIQKLSARPYLRMMA